MLRLSSRSLVVLVGASASGKSTWAAEHFRPEQVLSSDALRGVVGETTRDQRASKDAFAALDFLLERRLGRRLFTVVDSTGLDDVSRERWAALAATHELDLHAVVFEETATTCKARNRQRRHPVPQRVIAAQVKRVGEVAPGLADEGYTVHAPASVRVVAPAFVGSPAAAQRQRSEPMTMRFGLSAPTFEWEGGDDTIGERLAEVAVAAESVGFSSLWVMDHVMQIPSFGPAYERMLESYTTLAYLAGRTATIELGVLVSGITYRNPAHLGKIVATLDVLSGGRAWCGLGAAWFEREHVAYGWEFPPLSERYARLEDALQLLPLLWGPGTPAFEGRHTSLAEAACYPRPLRDPRPPILVGGSGEQRTLRLVAEYADACNIPGDVGTVRRKLDVLRRHCEEVGRDPADILVTQLGHALTGSDPDEVAALVDAVGPGDRAPETTAERLNAGTVEDQIGRYRELAEAGVGMAILDLPPVATVAAIERFAPVVAAFA